MIKSIRGMHDILPNNILALQELERVLQNKAGLFGYQEIRTPIVEQLDLFKRSAGEASDIVNKEMYTFADQNQDILALRPEGTAACVRSGIEHGLFYGKKQRLYYLGNMFRRERPQKGRYRQFSQFGLEAFGFSDLYIEVEIIHLVSEIFSHLNLKPRLEINHLGSEQSRSAFIEALVGYLNKHVADLDIDSKNRLLCNPLRILDTKVSSTIELLESAPKIQNYLSESELNELNFICDRLLELGIDYTIKQSLVRGLDYYTGMVFEWQQSGLTLCAGGRYDNLVGVLGGRPCPAIGVAIGIERLLESITLDTGAPVKISVLCNYLPAYKTAVLLAESLRAINWQTTCEFHAHKLKPLLKLANQQKSNYVILLGEQEFQLGIFIVKNMANGEDLKFNGASELLEYFGGENV